MMGPLLYLTKNDQVAEYVNEERVVNELFTIDNKADDFIKDVYEGNKIKENVVLEPKEELILRHREVCQFREKEPEEPFVPQLDEQ
jgi:hypothetical protein